jgi:hypothetical protein
MNNLLGAVSSSDDPIFTDDGATARLEAISILKGYLNNWIQ